MNEHSVKELLEKKKLLANWKKRLWEKTKQGKEKELGQYEKLPYSLEELEDAIKAELPKGGVLRAYAEINEEWKETLGNSLYNEIMRLYEICKECEGAYFDISEVEQLFHIEYYYAWNRKEFTEKCMDIIMKAPMKIQDKERLYEIQRHLFWIGSQEEVWDAYENKHLFPKEMLGTLYDRLQQEEFPKSRMAWIIAWLSKESE